MRIGAPGLDYAWSPEGIPRKPRALCIGAQKAGTSWLAQMLGQHPGVWVPPFKEAQFFNHRFLPDQHRWIAWHWRAKPQEIRDRHVRRGVPIPPELDAYLTRIATAPHIYSNRWYKQLFAPAPEDALPIDISPEYAMLPDDGVEFVARFLPRVRLIHLIRHPLDRAVSELRMKLAREGQRLATLDDWQAEVTQLGLLDRGDYAAQVPRWQARFGDRLLILPFGRIAANPAAVMAAVERHLNLTPARYQGLHDPVFRASPEVPMPPPTALAMLEARVAPQVAFLRETFGADFLAETR